MSKTENRWKKLHKQIHSKSANTAGGNDSHMINVQRKGKNALETYRTTLYNRGQQKNASKLGSNGFEEHKSTSASAYPSQEQVYEAKGSPKLDWKTSPGPLFPPIFYPFHK